MTDFILNNAWSLGGGGIAAVGLFWAGHKYGYRIANIWESIRNLGKKPG